MWWRRALPKLWESNYKAMSYEQLRSVVFPDWMPAKERAERLTYILTELLIKNPNKGRTL